MLEKYKKIVIPTAILFSILVAGIRTDFMIDDLITSLIVMYILGAIFTLLVIIFDRAVIKKFFRVSVLTMLIVSIISFFGECSMKNIGRVLI